MDDLLPDFLTETRELLAELDAALLRLERAPRDGATLSDVFRHLHTIKGTSGFLGLHRLEAIGHAGENLLGQWRDGAIAVTPEGITAILGVLDTIGLIVAALEGTGAEPAGSDEALIATLHRLSEGAEAAEDPTVAQPVTQNPGPAMPAGQGAAMVQTIRVSVDVLENLMTLVSELVLTRNQLMQLARTGGDAGLSVALQRLSHITSDLQDGVMKTRMQPIANAWGTLPRLVRDLGMELGKKIALRMRGEGTELDRQVLELIKDPLTHMVRNSADHGLEDPVRRKEAGKPETGTIGLNAYHEGGQIVIEIDDDGRGLGTDRIRAKMLHQGLATEAELAQMPERDIHRFVFRPGFSTAAAVTAVSGRGVGLDVVKTNLERIGGTVDVLSREGEGTVFTMRIPLTLAIVSALIVEAAGERFAIPQIGLLELVSVGGERDGSGALEWIKDTPVLRLRERLLPVVSLSRILALSAGEPTRRAGFVVVMQVGGHVFGLLVDRVFDTEEIVVKPVAPILRSLTMFSGNTILGDGSVIMILDPGGIARAAGLDAENGAGAAATVVESLGQRSRDRTKLLLLRAGDDSPKAVPLGLISRLEDFPAERIERSGDSVVVQYRGQLMPLVSIDGGALPAPGVARQAVLVFNEDDRFMGLAVDEILDVLEERLELSSTAAARPGFLGSAVIAGKVTEVLDAAHWLRLAGHDWFARARPRATEARQRILVVEDSGFFRSLIVPAIAGAGYEVVAVENGARALLLREREEGFDLLISDIEMPELDGLGFARQVRQGGPWRDLPMIALSSLVEPADIERGRAAGFTDYVRKYDREALLVAIRDNLAMPGTDMADNAHDARH